MKSQGYDGVTFDYEQDDSPEVTKEDWWALNNAFQKAGMKTGLTMAQAGLGTGLKFGYDCTNKPDPSSPPGTTPSPCFLAEYVPFDYNIPQLYGGYPLMYVGEYNNPDWSDQNFHGYTGQCTGNLDKIDCKPLTALCSRLNKNTFLLPSFGGQPPTNGHQGVIDLTAGTCGAGWDGKSFISWNITDPFADPKVLGGGNTCRSSTKTPEMASSQKGSYLVQSGDSCWSIAKSKCIDGNSYKKVICNADSVCSNLIAGKTTINYDCSGSC